MRACGRRRTAQEPTRHPTRRPQTSRPASARRAARPTPRITHSAHPVSPARPVGVPPSVIDRPRHAPDRHDVVVALHGGTTLRTARFRNQKSWAERAAPARLKRAGGTKLRAGKGGRAEGEGKRAATNAWGGAARRKRRPRCAPASEKSRGEARDRATGRAQLKAETATRPRRDQPVREAGRGRRKRRGVREAARGEHASRNCSAHVPVASPRHGAAEKPLATTAEDFRAFAVPRAPAAFAAPGRAAQRGAHSRAVEGGKAGRGGEARSSAGQRRPSAAVAPRPFFTSLTAAAQNWDGSL